MAKEGASGILNQEDHERVVQEINKGRYPERDMAIYMLGMRAGLRVGTVAQITLADIQNADGSLKTRVVARSKIMKGGKNSILYFNHPELVQALENYLKVRPNLAKVDNVFVTQRGTAFTPNSLSRSMLDLFKKAGLEGITFHGTRKSFATSVLKSGADIVALKTLLNHSDIGTTQRYVIHNDDYLSSVVGGI